MIAVVRREVRRHAWVLVAVPLAGAVVSSASFAVCMTVADWLLDAGPDDDMEGVG